MKTAFMIVDVQNDFLPGGALEVPKGDQVIALINQLVKLPFDQIVASKDWHPKKHYSFASSHSKQVGDKEGSQMLWPDHCIAGSFGAEFPKELDISKVQKVIYKGTHPNVDSYSAFFDNAKAFQTDLEDYLRKHEIEKIYIAGLATDYCVKYSCLDALSLGFKTYLIVDACKGVDAHQGDCEKALEEMRLAGACLVTAKDVFKMFE